MNEKKSSPIAAIKGILGSNRLLFICIVYTVAALGNVIKAFRDRIDFEGMQFFGISLSDLLGAELVDMLQAVANVLFVISLISLLPKILTAVGYWMIRMGASKGNGGTKTALIGLDFFKYTLLYQAFLKVSLVFGATLLGLVGAAISFSNNAAGIGIVIVVVALIVDAVLMLMFKYYTDYTAMLVGVSNTLRTGVNVVVRSRLVIVINVLSAVCILFSSFGKGVVALLAAAAEALCLIFINLCFSDFDKACGYASKEENAAIMERIKTDPALAKTAEALGIAQITPEEVAQGVKPRLSGKGLAKMFFGLSIAPVDTMEGMDYAASDPQSSPAYTATPYAAPTKPVQYGPAKEQAYRLLSLFSGDDTVLDARYANLGETVLTDPSSCPVALKGTRVVLDQVSEKKILRLTLRNRSVCAVKKVCLNIIPKTATEAPLCLFKDVTLCFDTAVAAGTDFGAEFGVILPDDTACGSMRITCVEFDDGLYWDKQCEELCFLTDEKRAYDEALAKRLEEQKRLAEQRAEAERMSATMVAADNDSVTEEAAPNSNLPLILAIAAAASLFVSFLGSRLLSYLFFQSGLSHTAVLSIFSYLLGLIPLALASAALIMRRKSRKHRTAVILLSGAVIAWKLFQAIYYTPLLTVPSLLLNPFLPLVVVAIIALVCKDKKLSFVLFGAAALVIVSILINAMSKGSIGGGLFPDTPDQQGSGITNSSSSDCLTFQSNGDGTCSVFGLWEDRITAYVEVPTYSPFGDLVTSVHANAFAYMPGVTTLVLPDSVKSIGVDAFRECHTLQSIHMPGVTHIESSAFVGCSSLTEVTGTHSLIGIGQEAFTGCQALTNFVYAPCLETIGYAAFRETGLESFVMSDSVTHIGEYAFADCYRLSNLRLSTNLDRIPYRAFSNCSSLLSLHIPGSVSNIDREAFLCCSSLIDVAMYPGVVCLESYAFAYCPALMYIYIPESVELIESETFYESYNITTVRYGGNEEGWQKFIRQDIDDYSWYEINPELRNAYVIYGVTLEQDPPGLPVPETTT